VCEQSKSQEHEQSPWFRISNLHTLEAHVIASFQQEILC
jgi:hypothetical protein